jgi:hypothetical protein
MGLRSELGSFGEAAAPIAGGTSAMLQAQRAYKKVRQGDYAGAAANVGVGALDAAAGFAPNPLTIGASIAGHAIQYASGESRPEDAVNAAGIAGIPQPQAVPQQAGVQAAIARRLAATKAASQATIARAAGPTAAGVTVNDLGSQPSTISQADLQARAAQMRAQAPGAGVGSDVPAYARRTPGITTGVADYSTLSPAEQAAFSRQGYVPPSAPAPAAPAPTTAAPAAAAPVAEAAPGLLARAGGLARGAIEAPFTPAGLAITSGISALNSYGRDTSDYARRFGVDGGTLPRDLALRTAGVATDAAATIGDLPLSVVNYARGKFGATPLQSFSSILQQNDNPAAAHQARVDRSAYEGANMTAAPPSNADFSNTRGDIASTAATTGLAPNVVPLPGARSDAGNPLPGKVVNGVRTFSDGSGNPNSPGYVPRTMTQAEISGLANGNRISVADAGAGGGIASEAAGRTLNLGEGAPQGSNRGFTAADRQNQYDAIQERGRNADFDRLMKKSEMALSRGSRKTAAILADLAGQARGPQAAAETGPGARLADARTQASIADAASTGADAKRKTATNSILDSLRDETDPNKRQDLIDTLLTSEGHPSGRVITLKVPSGQTDIAGNPVLIERPFDTRSRQYIDSPQAYGVR